MLFLKGNVERIAVNQKQINRLLADGFTPLEGEILPEEQKPVNRAKETVSQNAVNEGSLSSMTTAQLRELAKAQGLTGTSSLNKAELVEALKEVIGE